MRDEEIDWCIYRVIADRDAGSVREGIACTGFDPSVVKASIDRLIRIGLIGQTGDVLYTLPPHGFVAKCLLQGDLNSPVFIEQGVVKLKKDRENRI